MKKTATLIALMALVGTAAFGGGGADHAANERRSGTDALPEGMVLVPAGTFMMGSANGESNEQPVHQVTISKSFYIAKYEVTQAEWVKVMGDNPSKWTGDNLPVEMVSWTDVVDYCNKRSEAEGLTLCYSGDGSAISCDFTANGYRLPTEAEWEWAARSAGKGRLDYEYSGSDSADEVAWYIENSEKQTHPVGQKQANSLGLYDMSGNVWEWCWDWWGSYSDDPQIDPVGPASSTYRVLRGGSWGYSTIRARSANRDRGTPVLRDVSNGFRLVRSF